MSLKIYQKAWFWYVVALIVVALDQASKHAIEAAFEYGETLVFTSFFNFTLAYNTGAAFSFLADAGGWQRWFFAVIALAASVLLSAWIARTAKDKPREAFALAFILGGAIGNLYDRIVLGHVVDFIVVHYQDNYWPAFNLADSAITLGAAVLIIDMLFSKENSKEKKADA
ncbi:signal peptidase II [Cellvibrio sp. NN19]|uniref:signal peptidase II n=1 Tax=Cellvibrio chitinivorans TaxID=3102792 RepID=UPI002B411F3E|nr:signal peptidase II [Cellvibrio sp. NN19]